MHIDPAIAGLVLAMLGQLVGTVWWAASLNGKVESLSRWKDEHDDLRERMARMEQAMHDVRGALQRVEARLAGVSVAAE